MQEDPECVSAAVAQTDKSMAFAEKYECIVKCHVDRFSTEGSAYHTELVMDTHGIDGHFLPTSEEYANVFEGGEEDSK